MCHPQVATIQVLHHLALTQYLKPHLSAFYLMFAVSTLSVRCHSLNFSTKVAATVQPTRPQPETKDQRNQAGYEADESDEDEFFDVSCILTWFDTLHPYSDSPPLQVPGTPTETEGGKNRAGSKQVESDEDASLVNASTSSRLSLHASEVRSPLVTAPVPSQQVSKM